MAILVGTAACFGAPAAATAQLADTPWPMLQGGPLHSGRSGLLGPNFPSGSPGPNDVAVWKGFDKVKSSPTIGPDGTIYVGLGWSMCAIDPTVVDGTLVDKWPPSSPPVPPTRCRRLVADSSPSSAAIGLHTTQPDRYMVYIGDRGNTLNAFDDRGELIWRYRCGSEGDIKSSPVIDSDGIIYVAFVQNSNGAGVLTAIDPDAQGRYPDTPVNLCTHRWTYTAGNFIGTSSPALYDGVLYVGDQNGWFHAVQASTGALVWKRKVGNQINGSPVISSDGSRIYVGSTDGLTALDRVTGLPLWTAPTDGAVDQTPALAADGTIYAGSKAAKRKTLYAIGPDGVQKWAFGPIMVDADNGPFPFVSYEGTVYAAIGKTVYALRPLDGTVLWSHSVPMNIVSFPAIGGDATPEDGGTARLYVPSYDGNVYMLSSPRGSQGPSNSAPSVQASASVSSAVPGQFVIFSGAAIDADNDPLTFTWEFGDGETYLGPSVIHTYAAPGSYAAKLTVSDGIHSSEFPFSITVNPSAGVFTLDESFTVTTSLDEPLWQGGAQFAVSSGELRTVPGAGPHIAVLPSFQGPTQTVAADFASVNNQPVPRFGVILRYQDPDNYYLAYRKPGSASLLRIVKIQQGVETVLAQTGVPNPALNTFFRLSASAVGTTLSLEMNGMPKLTVDDTTFSTGSVGIMLDAGSSATLSYRADNISVSVQ